MLKEVTNHQEINRTKKDIKIMFVFSNKKKSKAHTCIFKLYPLLIQLRFRKSKGGLEFLQERNKKHKKAGKSGIINQFHIE